MAVFCTDCKKLKYPRRSTGNDLVPDSEKGFNKVADGKRRAGRVGKIRWYTRISGFGNAGFNHSDLCTPLKTENGANGKESHERLRMYPVIGAFSGVLICLLLV